MPRTKLAFVSLLSLLIVVAPVSAVLAKTGSMNISLNQVDSKEQVEEESKPLTSIFQQIEDQGGREVTDVKLDEEKGEGLFGAVVFGLVGLGVSIAYGITHNQGPATMARQTFLTVCAGVAAGAAFPEP